jgi:RimJ/RimL family protein N-acetyltransferase
MGFLPVVPVLDGSLVRLEPLSPAHAADLAVAAEEDRAAYGFTVVPRAWEVEQYLAAHSERAKSGMLEPFAQIRQGDGRAIGVTAYWDPRFWPGHAGPHPGLCAIDIGWTWLAASAQRTGINVEAKLLLAGYAFETLKVARVGFSTDARNEQSRLFRLPRYLNAPHVPGRRRPGCRVTTRSAGIRHQRRGSARRAASAITR